jgi:hypothetical protein
MRVNLNVNPPELTDPLESIDCLLQAAIGHAWHPLLGRVR